jgi:hypothetical protein
MFTTTRRGRLAAIAGLLAGLAVVVFPGTAHASYPPNYCDNTPNLGDYQYVDVHEDLYVFHYWSSVPTLDVADSRSFNNTSNSPQTATVSVTKTATTTLTSGVDETFAPIPIGPFKDFFSIKVSNSITNTHTTAIGSQLSYQVPPLATVTFDYGTVAYDVVYDLDKFELSQGHCWWLGSRYGVHAHAPTTNEQWRTTVEPTISPNGVVYYADYSPYNIHAGQPVAIFGQGFIPGDTVTVNYASGGQVTIGAGSPNWYDSPGQINATLPAGLTGQATVTVRAANGHTSNTMYINVNP